MNLSREEIMTALLNLLVGTLCQSFTADVAADSNVLTNVSTAGLIVGLPAFGPGIPAGATVVSVDVQARTATLSAQATATQASASCTAGFQTTGRRVLMWTKVSAQPALFVRNVGDATEYPGTVLPKVTIHAEVWIYSNAGGNPDLAPGIALNQLVDAVESALAPTDPITQRQTLGGLVENCYIEGESTLDPGDLDGQAKAVIPVHILVP